MDKIFELNTVNNVKDSVGTSKVKATSPIVEVFSALSQGNRPTVDGKVVDCCLYQGACWPCNRWRSPGCF